MKIDLHLHTTYSDGIYPPEEVVKLSRANGLDVISLTDHDTVGAYQELGEIETNGLKIIRGAEITANHAGNGIHILGYFKDGLSEQLQDFLNNTQAERINRIKEGLRNLRKHNINLSYDELNEFNKGESRGVKGTPTFFINGNRTNSSWKKHLEKEGYCPGPDGCIRFRR